MRHETRTIYTLAELKAASPKGYAKVLSRWQDVCDRSGDTPWADETMDSLKAVVEACGGTVRDYSIGAYSQGNFLKVDVADTIETDDNPENDKPKDADWLRVNILKPNGYTKANGHAYFPGNCHWTGYCADDDMIESVYKAMVGGATLTDALEGLCDVAEREFEQNAEQAREEESMEANWGDNEYTEDGDDA